MQHISEVDDYIQEAPEEQQGLLRKLRNIIDQAVNKAEEKIKWKQPVYTYQGKDFAYLKSYDHYVHLGFFDFEHLEDPQGLLEGTGKRMRHIKVKSDSDVDEVLLTGMLQQAADNA